MQGDPSYSGCKYHGTETPATRSSGQYPTRRRKPKAPSETDNPDSQSDSDKEDELKSDVEDGDEPELGEHLDLTTTTAAAAQDAARCSTLYNDIKLAATDLEGSQKEDTVTHQIIHGPPQPPRPNTPPASLHVISSFQSDILSTSGKVSVSMMLKAGARLQSGTTVNSERIIKLNPKFDLARLCDGEDIKEQKKNTQTALVIIIKRTLKYSVTNWYRNP